MQEAIDRSKTLQELEQSDWGEADDGSQLVKTCHRLRRVPLTDYTTEDFRIMISQRIGIEFLVPLAVAKLEEDPLAEGDFYPGDLLNAVLQIPESFWNENTDICKQARRVVSGAKELLVSLDDSNADIIRGSLSNAPDLLIE